MYIDSVTWMSRGLNLATIWLFLQKLCLKQRKHQGSLVLTLYDWNPSHKRLVMVKYFHVLTSSYLLWLWWRHQMETFSALLALCEGNHRSLADSPYKKKPVMRSFDVFFDLRLNKRWTDNRDSSDYYTPSRSLWHHCNVMTYVRKVPQVVPSIPRHRHRRPGRCWRQTLCGCWRGKRCRR